MPPLALHMTIAKGVADRLRTASLDDERGNLYVGSTAPDIRVMTRWERERTHFFDLANFDDQSGIVEFLRAHPRLAAPASLDAAARAFVAGYLTHLVMDETWIGTIYRPFFGERSPLRGDLRANVMDRALQFSMDCDRRRDDELMAHIVDAIVRCDLALEVGLIDSDTLRHWRQVVTDMVSQPPDWGRFRHGARRHLGEADQQTAELLDELAESLPDLVDETLRYLTPRRVQEFMQESLERGLAVVREYLACA